MAGNYTWNGATNNQWGTASNWSTGVVPSSNDTVNIGSGSDTILIAANTTIYKLAISGRTINIGGYELEVANAATLTGGKIYNGTLKLRGSFVTFEGTHTDCAIDCITAQLELSGGVFDGEVRFEQNSSADGYGDGGCVFNAPAVIIKSAIGMLRLGQSLPDTFNSRVEFINTFKQPLEISYGSASVFYDLVSLSCSGISSSITVGNATHAVQLLESAALVTGEGRLTDGILTLKGIHQSSLMGNELTGDDGLVINMDSCTFSGDVTLTAPSILLKNSVFAGDAIFTKIRTSSNSHCYGGNAFYGSVMLDNQDDYNAFRFANITGDHFYKDVTLAEESSEVQMSYTGTTWFEGDIISNSDAVLFNTNNGNVVLTGSENQTLSGTAPYAFCKLEINKTTGSVQLNQQAVIDSAITFVSGILYTDSLLTLKATATTIGASNLSYVDGTVKKIGNTAFIFPVGADNSYFPIEISAPSLSTESFTAKYYALHHSLSDSCDTTISSISTCNYWRLSRNTGSTNVQVRLHWDSLGCGLFDTSGIHVINWNGVKWKDLGASGITGNARFGSIASNATVSQFDYFTIGVALSVISVNPTLGDDRELPPDFFGFNGSNTINVEDGTGNAIQTWKELLTINNGNPAVLSSPSATILRVPAGNLSNFADWRSGWPILERDLPFNWFYDKISFKKVPNSYIGNTYDFVRDNLEILGAQAMITWNMMSSKFYYELASIYRLQELNVPIRYLEFGNEFYLNDEYYKEVFPSVNSYVDRSIEYATTFRNFQLPQTAETKIAMVGADVPATGPGRRRLWLDNALKRLPNTNNIDAIVIHDYIGETPSSIAGCAGSFKSSALYAYLETAFVEEDYLKDHTFDLIEDYNSSKFSTKPLEIWLTEFNMLDNKNRRIGTWSHGLFNSVMALKYLETDAITKVISHTLTNDAIYGNIFESVTGFKDVPCHGKPYRPNATDPHIDTQAWELTAVGNALAQISKAMKNADKAYPLDFSGTPAQSLTLDANGLYPFLYGWVFERPTGDREVILLNLGGNQSYNVYLGNAFPGIATANTISFEQLRANNQEYAITGNAISSNVIGANASDKLQLETGFTPFAGTVPFVQAKPFSLTRVFIAAPALQVRLTDDEICRGSSTTLIVEGGTLPYTFTPVTGLDFIQYDSNNDHIWVIQTNSTTPATDHQLRINGNVVCTLKVHQDLDDLQIVDGGNNPITSALTYCPGSASISLSASFSPGHSNAYTGNYHYLWAPGDIDSGMVSSVCAGNTPMCNSINVAPERTTIYTVYVTDEHCWKSASVTVNMQLTSFDLGEDITFCAGITDVLSSNYVGAIPAYLWSTGATASSISLASLSPGIQTITLTVTDNNCSIDDKLIVNVLECCSIPSGAFSLTPHKVGNSYISHENDLLSSVSNCTTCVTIAPPEIILDGDFSSEDIFIDGEFVLRSGIANPYNFILKNWTIQLGDNASISIDPDRKLTLENCTLVSCGNKMWNSIILDKEGSKFIPSIEVKNCIIKDAITGITLTREAIYSITGNTFEDCYLDIDMSTYQSKANGKIEGNTFTSSGALTMSPHSSAIKYAGIVLNDVEDIDIGKVSSGTNTFSNSLYGIKSTKSSFKLINNTFSEIWDNATTPAQGTAVHAISDFDQNDRLITVGNGFGNGTNVFKKSMNGIYTEGEMSIDISKNTFGNSNDYADRIRNGCVVISNNTKSILIENDNKFYDYKYGIAIGNPYGKFVIKNNLFYDAVHGVGPTSFEGTAININRVTPIALIGSEISDNTVGEAAVSSPTPVPAKQPRIGIRLSQVNKVKIAGNTILYDHVNSPEDPHLGMWVEHCAEIKIENLNDIDNKAGSFPTGSNNLLIGLKLNDSPLSCIEENNFTKMGYGMHVSGNSIINSLYKNMFNEFDIGIYLAAANIGASVGTESPPNSGNGNVMGNEWALCSGCTATTKISGSLSNSTGLKWYTDYPSGSKYPDNSVQGGLLLPTYLSVSTTAFSECLSYEEDTGLPLTLRIRNETFGGIVTDSIRYPDDFHDEFRYNARQMAFSILKKNSNLIVMDDDSDTSFVRFYNETLTSNINKIDSLETLMAKRCFVEADTLLIHFTDTNAIEYNYKRVYRLYIKQQLYGDTSLTNSDWDELYAIAMLHPLTGGKAVFAARNVLKLEVHDDELSSARMMQTNIHEEIGKLLLYPNPANEYLTLKWTGPVRISQVSLLDITGRIVLNSFNTDLLVTSRLTAGLYYVKARVDENWFNGTFIISR